MNSYNGFSGDQRARAQRWMNEQWRTGKLERPSCCDACGQVDGAIHGHAEDYSEPFGPHLQEYWLCFLCHMMLHCRFRNPEAWERYREQLRQGARFAPARTFGDVVREHIGRPGVPDGMGAPRGPTVLDLIETLPGQIVARKKENDGQGKQRSLWGEQGPPR